MSKGYAIPLCLVVTLFISSGQLSSLAISEDIGLSPGTVDIGIKSGGGCGIKERSMGNDMFIENRGQWEKAILFKGTTSSGSVFIFRDGFGLETAENESARDIISYTFNQGFCQFPRTFGTLPTKYNYYYGSDPKMWVTGARSYEEVTFENVWDEIDVRLYFSEIGPKYDILVHPGGDPDDVQFRISGMDALAVDVDDIEFMKDGKVIGRDSGLSVYQGHEEREVEASYRISADNTLTYEIGNYLQDETLVIDPVLYGNFLGGSGSDEVKDTEIDQVGDHYLTGLTTSTDFPVTPGSYNETFNWIEDVFLSKVSSNGSVLLYSTFIGGSANDHGMKIALDGSDSVFLTGNTGSKDFPTTPDAVNSTKTGNDYDAFLLKMDPGTGSLEYSTFIGGGNLEEANDICLAPGGDIIITGVTVSNDFPIRGDVYRGKTSRARDVFLCRIASDLSDYVFSTRFGGTGADIAMDLQLLQNGDLVISGDTTSSDLDMISGGYRNSATGENDCFVYVLNGDGSSLKASTYFGGNQDDHATGLGVDPGGNIYLGGYTDSYDFPITKGSYQTLLNNHRDIFIARFNGMLSILQYSTYLGSGGNDTANDLIVDSRSRTLMVGNSDAWNFPVTWGAFQERNDGGMDGIFLIFDTWSSELVYSTYYGGYSDDECYTLDIIDDISVLISGFTTSSDLPLGSSGFAGTPGLNRDGFACGLDISLPPEPPMNLSVVFSTPGVNISWDPPVQQGKWPVTRYILAKVKMDDSPRVRIYEIGHNKHYYHDTDVAMGYRYVYRIAALSMVGTGNYTENATVDYFFPPSKPLELNGEIQSGALNLTWGAPAFDGGSPVVGYLLEKEQVDIELVWTYNTTSEFFMDINITKGKEFIYRVWAKNSRFLSEDPAIFVFKYLTIPSPPIGLNTTYGNRYVNISWNEPIDYGGSPLMAYHIYRGLDPDTCTILSTIKGNNTYFNDTSVVNGIVYYYRVSTATEFGVSVPSAALYSIPIGPPSPPWGLEYTVKDTVVYLAWEPPTTDGGSPILQYRIYRWLPGVHPQMLISLSGHRNFYNDTSVEPNSEYSYYLTAVSVLGESDPSEIVTAALMGRPTNPRSLKAIAGPGFVTMEWMPPSDMGYTPLTGYKLYRRAGDGFFILLAELTRDEEFYIDEDITLGVSYFYRVTALNEMGESRPSPEIAFYPVNPPSPPGNLMAFSTEDLVELSWSIPVEDGGLPIAVYHIYRGPDSLNMSHLAAVNGLTTDYVDRDVEVGMEYYYQVMAFNGVYNSSRSQVAKGFPKGLPGPVIYCAAMLVNRSMELSWSPPENTGGTDILYYFVYRRNKTGFFEQIAKVPGSQTFYVDSNLFSPGLYVYYVVAENGIGRGPQSVKFDEEVPSSFFEEGDKSLGTSTTLALLFLGASLVICLIAVFVFIRRGYGKGNSGSEPVPVPMHTDLYPAGEEEPSYYPEEPVSCTEPHTPNESYPREPFEEDPLDFDLQEFGKTPYSRAPVDIPEE